jgi:hypothetical protein
MSTDELRYDESQWQDRRMQDQQYRDGSSAEQSARYAAEELAWSRKSSYPREFFS